MRPDDRCSAAAPEDSSASAEADERMLGHATAPGHRIAIRRRARHLVVRQDDQPAAATRAALVLAEPATTA